MNEIKDYYRWHLRKDDPNDLPPAIKVVDNEDEGLHYTESLPVVAYLGDAEYSDGSIEPMYRCGTYSYDEVGYWFLPYVCDPIKADKVIAWKYIEPIPVPAGDRTILDAIKSICKKWECSDDSDSFRYDVEKIIGDYAKEN